MWEPQSQKWSVQSEITVPVHILGGEGAEVAGGTEGGEDAAQEEADDAAEDGGDAGEQEADAEVCHISSCISS